MARNEHAETSLSSSLRACVICPIFGTNFTSTLQTPVLNSAAHTVRILDITQLNGYSYGTDPESIEILFQKESLPSERKSFLRKPSQTYISFIERVVKNVRLQSSVVHAYPDPKLFEVLVILTKTNRITANDYGILIPKRSTELSSLIREKPSMQDLL